MRSASFGSQYLVLLWLERYKIALDPGNPPSFRTLLVYLLNSDEEYIFLPNSSNLSDAQAEVTGM